MLDMKVKNYMTEEVIFIGPDFSLRRAAEKMTENDCGFLPVGSQDDLLGVITDRDIVIRAVCIGKDVSTEKVRKYMSKPVVACNENDTLEDAIEKMHSQEVGRLVVKNKKGQVVGILSLGSILAREADASEIANIVKHSFGTMLRRLVA